MVSKATYFEAHKSLYPPTLQPKLRSSNWGCAAAPGTGVTHTQHRVECSRNKLPHPSPCTSVHHNCTLSHSKPTEEGHRLSCHMTISLLLLRRQFWGRIPFHLVTNSWQMFPDRQDFKDAACSTDWAQPYSCQPAPLCPTGTHSLWKTDSGLEDPSSTSKDLNKNVRAFCVHDEHLLN